MKLLFVSRLFHGVAGGIERMATAMMNEFHHRGFDVQLLSWDRADAKSFFQLSPAVKWHTLNCGDARFAAAWSVRLKRMKIIREIVHREKPDLIIAFQQGPFLAVALSTLGCQVPVIAAERNSPDRFNYLRSRRARSLIMGSFLLADCVTVQQAAYTAEYPWCIRGRIRSIPNPVEVPLTRANVDPPDSTERILLSVGRLTYQKNQSILLEAFAKIASSFPNWRLRLVGDGEDEVKLRELARAGGIWDKVDFVGAVSEVRPFYAASHLFCLASRWEGFPNAVAEAMSHGLPVVGFDGCAGIRHLVDPGVTGLLARGNGDSASLAEALHSLMTRSGVRSQMGIAAAQAMEQFRPKVVFDRWEALFREVVSNR